MPDRIYKRLLFTIVSVGIMATSTAYAQVTADVAKEVDCTGGRAWGGADYFRVKGKLNRGLGFGTNNVQDRVVIDTSGNVGIGTTTPTARLDVRTGNPGDWERGVRVLSPGMQPGNNTMITVGQSDGLGGGSLKNAGHMYFHYVGPNLDANHLSFGLDGINDVLNISGSANVGIGTNAPQVKLDVVGDIKVHGNIVSDGDICIGKCN